MHSLLIASVAMSAQSAVWNWIHRLGGVGLIFLGLADSSLAPLPGSMDVFTILLSAHHRPWWPYYGAMATAGAVLGGYLTYRLAEKGGEQTLERKVGRERAEKVYKKFEKQGGKLVFLGSVLPPPFPIVPVVMAAGVMQYPKKKFLAALSAGRGVRFFSVAFIGHTYGKAIIGWVSQYYQPVLYGLITMAILGGISALIYFKWYSPRQKKQREAALLRAQEAEQRAA